MSGVTFQDAETCPIRQVLRQVTGKWTSLVLLVLSDGEKRFGELDREIGDISHQVLSNTLKKLEQDGYIARRVVPNRQIEVYYSLTSQGSSFITAFMPLVEWATANFDAVHDNRIAFEKAAS